MVAVLKPPPPPADAAGPVPRRLRAPRWLDLRLVLGVLLVLGSVLAGARIVTAAGATAPVWAAGRDLAAGTVLTSGDLVPVDVRLQATGRGYLPAGTPTEGRALAHAVRAGELVPRSALDEPGAAVQVALPVQAGYAPPGLSRGQLVDVYAVAGAGPGSAAPAAPAAGSPPAGVTPVVVEVPVQAVSGRAEGALSAPTSTVQVVVSVPAARAPAVLAAIGGRSLVVVVHESLEGRPSSATARPSG